MAIDILVAGMRTSTEVEHAVRRAIRDVATRDRFRVALLPSDRDGRWDLGLNGPGGWSVTWFDSPVEDLPRRAAREVRLLLENAALARA